MRDWLIELRRAKGLTQAQVGEMLRLSDVAVTHWETGKHRPTYDKMLALADLLGPEVMERFAAESKSDGRVA